MKEEDVDYNKFNSSIRFNSKVIILLIILTGFFLLFAIIIDITTIQNKKNITKSLNQIEVVQLYYNSVNSYDIGTVLACVNSKKVNAINNGVIANLVFNIRRNMEDDTHGGKQNSQEGIIYIPQEWVNSGKPELKVGERVEGINNLEINKINESEIICTYDYYYTVATDYDVIPIPEVVKKRDICIVKKIHGNWTINQIIQE